jgi:hypothetical protein
MQGRKEGVEVEELTSPVMAGGASGSQMREYITKGDVKAFQATLPGGLSQTDKDKIWEIVSEGHVSMQEYFLRVINEVLSEAANEFGPDGPDASWAMATTAVVALDKDNLKKIVQNIQLRGAPMEESRIDRIAELTRRALEENWIVEPKTGCIGGCPYEGKIEEAPPLEDDEDATDAQLEEVSSMGGGSAEMGGGNAWSEPEEPIEYDGFGKAPGGKLMEYKTFSRKQILEDILLRENIRKTIIIAKKRRRILESKENRRTRLLRKVIRELLLEAEETAPHEATGINVLEDLLKKVVPQIEGDYKTLTTDKEQRTSFRAHILNATENAIAPKAAVQPDAEEKEDGAMLSGEEGDAGDAGLEDLEEIEIKVGDANAEEEVDAGDITSLDDDEKLIDIGDMGGAPQDDESFQGLEGEDDTGRNMANMSFQKIEKSITDSYALLGNEEDQELFRDYLLTNLKLYFDKFEDELGAGGEEEPTTPEYEEEKGAHKEKEAAGGEDTEEGGGEDTEEGGEEELDLDF